MRRIFNLASLFAVAVMLFSCEKASVVDTGVKFPDFQLIVTNDVFKNDGVDGAKFTALYEGTDVTAEAKFLDANKQELNLDNGVLRTTKEGVIKVFARYGAMSTYNTEMREQGLVSVRAVSYDVPAVAADPNPGKTSFVHRAFLTQYTGTNCGYCPQMVEAIRELYRDNTIPDKAVLTAIHDYNSNDPAYIIAAPASPGGHPYMQIDLTTGFSNTENNAAMTRSLVDQSVADKAKVGVSVNSVYYADKKTVVAKVQIKAVEDGYYNIGAWLLEDNIFGQQAGAKDDSYNTHNNCVRVADSYYYDTYFGHFVGQLKAGETAEKTFIMVDTKNVWKAENLHIAAFASYGYKKNGKTYYTVANAVDAAINGETRYEYK